MQPTVSRPPEGQEYPYGWRDVFQDGQSVRIALSLEDCLYPQEGDVLLEGSDHDIDCVYLANVSRSRPLGPAVAFVTRDMGVNWSHPGIGNHSPDIGVWVGLSRDPRPTALLDLKGLGGTCKMIVEVVSPSTRHNDVVTKRRQYHEIGVPHYVIIDQQGESRYVRNYHWTPTGYEHVPPDEQGRFALPVLGLLLAMRDNHAVCFDAATGEQIADFSDTRQDLLQTRQNLTEERERTRQYKDEVDRQFTEQRDEWLKIDRARQAAETLAKEQAEAREAAEKLVKEQAEAREAAEKLAKEQAEAREVAEKLAKEQAEAREAAEKLAKEQREQYDKQLRELREQLQHLQAGGTGQVT